MRTLSILSRKGGTGKTTLALHLAVAARASGLSTMVADLDRQQSAVDWRRLREPDDLRVEAVKPGALFPRQQDLARQGLDLLIVDTGPSVEGDVEQAARCADLCVIVARPNFFDVRAVADSAALVSGLSRPAVFVINQAPSRRSGFEPPTVMRAVRDLQGLGYPVAPIGLRARATYQHGVAAGRTAQELDPHGMAACEIGALWSWMFAALWPTADYAAVPRHPVMTAAPEIRPVC